MKRIDIFPWNDNFETGIPEIDGQHRQLVALLNQLATYVAYGSDPLGLSGILEELVRYTVYHFETEEGIWRECFGRDPMVLRHDDLHGEFVATIRRLKDSEAGSSRRKVADEMLAFLTRWLVSHILESDRYLAYVALAVRAGKPLAEAKADASGRMSGATRVLTDIILAVYETLSINALNLMEELFEHKNAEERYRQIFDTSLDAINIIRVADSRQIEVNPAFETITGYRREEVLGRASEELGLWAEPAERLRLLDVVRSEGCFRDREVQFRRRDGELIWGLVSCAPIVFNGEAHLLSVTRDITDRKRAERELAARQAQLDTLIQSVPDAIQFKDGEGRWLIANDVCLRIFGLAGKEWEHLSDLDIGRRYPALAATMASCRAGDEKAWESGGTFHVEEAVDDGTGRTIHFDVVKVPLFDEEGRRKALVIIARDISERKKSELELRIAATAFESQEGMLITDANAEILRVNGAFTEITGYGAAEAIGRNPRFLASGRQDAHFYAAMWRSVADSGRWEGEIWNRRKNGEIYPQYLAITAVKDVDGAVMNYVASMADITQRKNSEEEIQRLAFYDQLTGLPNRRLLMDRLKQALAVAGRKRGHGALFFIDLDNFKTLNDTLGHLLGDLLLQQVGERLSACVREGDTVSRLGGDEFVVMLEDLSEDVMEALRQSETVGGKILAALRLPYRLLSHTHTCTPSVGVAIFHGRGQSTEDVLKQADIAMYQAKRDGRDTLRFFDARMQRAISERAALEAELRQAIEGGQFELHYQPQIDGGRRVSGAEALLRWQHPVRGMVAPADFIPLAEESGLIVSLGHWVIDSACARLSRWAGDPLTRELDLAVNVSARQFREDDFVSRLSASIRRHAVDPRRLKLELTESLLLANVDETVRTMEALHALGVRFSLDDFGTGYSSLQYLKRLPIDQLKIDKSFVADITSNASDRAIIVTIIAMARTLALDVIAEGVETEAQFALLAEGGCRRYQGFLFGRPLPAAAFEASLAEAG